MDTQVAQTPEWVTLCSKAAPIAAVIVFAAPIPTVRNIIKNKSVGKLPLLPYSSMVGSTFVWITYGMMRSEIKVWAPNLIGLVLGLCYCYFFRRFTLPSASNLPGTFFQHVIGIIILIVLTLTLQITGQSDFIGKMGVALCIVMFASPLAVINEVIQTRSAKNIPLPFTIACLINCLFWFISGVFDYRDFNIYFPNLLGLVSAMTQSFLFILYGSALKESDIELPILFNTLL